MIIVSTDLDYAGEGDNEDDIGEDDEEEDKEEDGHRVNGDVFKVRF